jgi:hypothetical protein
MSGAAILLALLRFIGWEAALLAASVRLARAIGWRLNAAEFWLGALAINITLESSVAAIFSFVGINSPAAYWMVAAVCAVAGCWRLRVGKLPRPGPMSWNGAFMAALATPLVLLSFRPVEEIDSINYLHYLIDWMGNRATPYTFATNYVAFWELSFLPVWTVTRVDLFFPLLAAKSVILIALALWLVGRELEMPRALLGWTIFGALTMRYYWFQYSGVPTLKNDVLHGVGFVLLVLVVLRAARGVLLRTDLVLFAFGIAFAAVKYTGIFVAGIAVCLLLILRRLRLPQAFAIAAFFVVTSGHYYLRSLIEHGSPFYPFQINLAFIRLPGTADLSYSSILYNLHDPRLWRAFFLPAAGVSPVGILFPEILAGALLASFWRVAGWAVRRRKPTALDWTALLLLCGWLLYFRAVFSASGGPGDLAFILNSLNSIRYVDGVLAVSELFLVALLCSGTRPAYYLASFCIAVNTISRLLQLDSQLPVSLFPILAVIGLGLASFFIFRLHRGLLAAGLLLATPLLVEHSRAGWTTYWNELKPAIQSVRGPDLAELALEDGGYFAGHVVAAGNPLNPSVRTLLPQELDTLPPVDRPRFLAVLVTPGSGAASDWWARYGSKLSGWGYQARVESQSGAVFERVFR